MINLIHALFGALVPYGYILAYPLFAGEGGGPGKKNSFSLIRLEDGQDMGSALLYAEAKLGELLKGIHPQSSQQGRCSLPEGITHKQSHYAQTLADHPEET